MNSSRRPIEGVLSLLRNVRTSGTGKTAQCPAHEDRQNSLSIAEGDDGRVLLKCHAGCSAQDVVAAIGLKLRNLFPDNGRDRQRPRGKHMTQRTITVEGLTQDKRIPAEFMRSLGIKETPGGVLIPYQLMDGMDGSVAPRQRLRSALKAKDGSIWLPGDGNPVPYGLWRLKEAREHCYLILVEGESDCWTLWFHGLPALGLPGATMAAKLEIEYLDGIARLYLFEEHDRGGRTFVEGVLARLREIRWSGQIFVVRLEAFKDPNDLHRSDPDGFRNAFQRALDGAQAVPLEQVKDATAGEGDGNVVDLLVSSALAHLSEDPSPDELDAALRRLGNSLEGADPLRRKVARGAAVKSLERLGVRAPASLVDAALNPTNTDPENENVQGRMILFSDPAPWDEPVEGSALLDDLAATLTRFLVLEDGAPAALALWTMHSYLHAAAVISAILAITSPVKRCGKSTLLHLLGALTPRPLLASNITTAALFRTVERFRPTLLVDEADTFLARNDELRGVLNSGHLRATARVVRTVGDDHEPRTFSTWSPKVIALIGRLPETLEDRSIVVAMRRKSRGEQIERLRRDRIEADFEPLRRQAARWAADHLDELRDADPVIPEALDDRAADNWRPLLAIADLAGGDWPDRSRKAALLLSGTTEETDNSAGILLLADVRALFVERGVDRLASGDIVDWLGRLEGRPWPEWRNGRPVSANQVAKLLKPFGVKPKTIRLPDGSTPKGYMLGQFTDPFSRYLPFEAPQAPRGSVFNVLEADPNRHAAPPVAVPDQGSSECKQRDVAAVADRRGGPGTGGHASVDPDEADIERFEI